MTVCAVWQDGNGLQLASDSRLTIHDRHVDTSIKVTTFPLTILAPTSQGVAEKQVLLRQQLGFCAAGDLAPTLAVKESLRILLGRLWAVPGQATVSMQSFAEIVAAMLKPLWYQAASALGNDTSATVALAGYCPEELRGRAFLLRTDASEYPASVRVDEVDLSGPPVYFGSGGATAAAIAEREPPMSPLYAIRRAVANGSDPSIGGRVQYGKLVQKDFEVLPIYDITVDHGAKTFTGGYYLGGMELVEPQALPLPEGFEILPKAADVAAAERAALMAAGYRFEPKYSHFITLFENAASRTHHFERE